MAKTKGYERVWQSGNLRKFNRERQTDVRRQAGLHAWQEFQPPAENRCRQRQNWARTSAGTAFSAVVLGGPTAGPCLRSTSSPHPPRLPHRHPAHHHDGTGEHYQSRAKWDYIRRIIYIFKLRLQMRERGMELNVHLNEKRKLHNLKSHKK